MEHKAYEFNWKDFEEELLPLLKSAIAEDSESHIEQFIESNLDSICDPYEGEVLTTQWREKLESETVQELCDFALTKYYSVATDVGVADEWLPIQSQLAENELSSLLGSTILGFDPGCYGSYFQTPAQLKNSIEVLSQSKLGVVEGYVKAVYGVKKGLYVTF